MGNELEVKIQEEVRKRVIQEDHRRDNPDDGSDTVEALSQITSLPKHEVERIAKEVRVEQTLKHTFRKVAIIGAGVFGVGAAVIGAIIYLLFAL